MEYVDQSAGALRLCLAQGVFDYTQFTILKKIQLSWKDMTVHVGILGESHYVMIEDAAHNHFHEICACTEIDTTQAQEIVQLDLLPNLETDQTNEVLHRFNYTFSYQYHDHASGMQEMDMMTKHAETADHITELAHTFPANDEAGGGAVTKVFVEQRTQLFMQTFHTYPNEGIVVSTRSQLIDQG